MSADSSDTSVQILKFRLADGVSFATSVALTSTISISKFYFRAIDNNWKIIHTMKKKDNQRHLRAKGRAVSEVGFHKPKNYKNAVIATGFDFQ